MADIENFDGREIVDKVQEKFEANKKFFYIALAVIVIGVGGYWWLSKQSQEANMEASNLVWKPEFNFAKDSFNLAINGDMNANYAGYAAIAEEYSGTDAGQIAKYSMGVGYLNMGNFDAAINALSDVSFDDEILGAVAKGALGDAYYEKGDADNALDAYSSAINHSSNEFTAPIYLKKKAFVHEDLNENEKAIEAYERIKKDYPTSREAAGVEKYIARLKK